MPGCAGKRAALVGAADQQPDDAFRNARLMEAVDEKGAGSPASFPTA